MNSRYEQVFIGLIVLLAGLIFMLGKSQIFGAGGIAQIVIGLSLLLLYRTKRKPWALIVGAFILFPSALDFLQGNLENFAEIKLSRLSYPLGLMAVGSVLLILFNDFNKNGLLIPGAVILAFGLNSAIKILLPEFSSISHNLSMSAAFAFIYSRGKYFLGNWPKYVSIFFLFPVFTKLISGGF